MQSQSHQFDIRLLYISGDKSTVGKTTLCMCLLDALLKSGYDSRQLAYVKPASQCISTTLIWKYCHNRDIIFRGLGPVLFYTGFTEECLLYDDSTSEFAPQRLLGKIKHCIDELLVKLMDRNRDVATQRRKLFIIVDGVGYPSVSSLCGISNGQVARFLNIPIVQATRACTKYSLGNTIDSYMLNKRFNESYDGVKVLGVIFNRLRQPEAKSSNGENDDIAMRDRLCRLVKLFFEKRPHEGNLYGMIDEVTHPSVQNSDGNTLHGNGVCVAPRNASSDALNKRHLEMTEQDKEAIDALLTAFHSCNPCVARLLADVDEFFEKHPYKFVHQDLHEDDALHSTERVDGK